jgi:hypothetical protein
MTVDQEVYQLDSQVQQGLTDAEADYDEETIESGGWVDIVRSVVSMSDASDQAKREVLRMNGLDPDGSMLREP